MYTLRKVIDNIQSNQELGSNYQVVDRETNYQEFCKAFEALFKEKHTDYEDNQFSKNCYIILTYNDGSSLVPLYKNQSNYIMTESGKTFSNLTYK